MADRKQGLVRRFASDWMARHWRLFALGLLLSAVTAAAASSYGVLIKLAGDWLQAGDVRVVWPLPAFVVAAAIIRSLSLYGQTMANNAGVQRGLVDVQNALFARLIEGDFARLSSAATGEFVSRFINDMNIARDASLRVATNLAKGVLTLIGCLAAMIWLDWALALLVFVVYPIAFAPVIRIGERLRKTSKRAQEQTGEMTALLTEGFLGARTVKAYGLEAYQRDRAQRGFLERARLYLKVLRGKALVDPLLEIVGGAAMAGVLAFAGWRILNGDATVGDFLGFIAALAVASPEVRALGTLNAVVNEGLAAADRIYAVLDAPDAVEDQPGAIDLPRTAGAVTFENVEFSYGDANALDGLTLEAKPGETIALVGPSGAGKSTVFNLLLRLYDVSGGRVSVDGVDIREAATRSLRANLSLVSQDAFLFDDTLRANIAFGRPGAADAELEAAAEAAACDFIADLPEGLDAPAGEGGRNLSGGQRQRISIARALLKDAPILLLDEATSALDAQSEDKVKTALARLSEGRTTLVVAHRLSTVRSADRIYVLNKGRVAEVGDHDTLAAAGGLYADLVKLQLS